MTNTPKLDPLHYPPRVGGIPLIGGDPGVRHNITIIDTDCPGLYEISCQCGKQSFTPWGADRAEQIARLHLLFMGQTQQRVIR